MKTHILTDGEGVELKSEEVFLFACCDCGLTHQMVIVAGRKGRSVGFAVKRDDAATKRRRRVMARRKK